MSYRRGILSYLLPFVLLALSGCSFVTAHQGPALIDSEEALRSYGFSLGAFIYPNSASTDETGFSGGIPLLYGQERWRLKEDLEGGIRIAGVPYLGSMVGDLKYLVMDQPFLVTADMGLGLYQMRTLGLHPMIIVGSERLYGGIQQNFTIPFTSHAKEDLRDGRLDPPVSELFVGAIIGDKVKFMPEVRLFSTRDTGIVLAALLGLRWDRPMKSNGSRKGPDRSP